MPRTGRVVEIVMSLGASLGLICSPLIGGQAQAQHHGHAMQAQHAESGEAATATGPGAASEALDDADILLVLAQMQGHLLIAQELIDQQLYRAAEPHVGHPVDELYGSLAPALRHHRIQPFLPVLEELRQAVRLNPQAPVTSQLLKQAQQTILVVTRSLPGMQMHEDQLLRAVIPQLVLTAVQEYDGALAGDQLVEVTEYQDGRGFLRQALLMVQQAMASQPQLSSQLAPLAQTLQAMQAAFPTVIPPHHAVMSLGQLQRLQNQI